MPWLQDFSLGRTYTLADVAAQIASARTEQTGGFMLWNAVRALHRPAPSGPGRRRRCPTFPRRSSSLPRSQDPSRCIGGYSSIHSAMVRAMATTRAIHLQTEIPGPKSRAILERKERVVADPLSIYLPVVVAEGRGSTLTDVDGNTFVDFAGGVGCLNVGHAHPHVVEAVQEQAARFLHTDFTMVPYEVYVTLAERLLAVAPFSGPAKAAFFNAGTEAVENAVKFARAYTRRPAIIAFDGAFHGRTLMSLTLTSKTHPYKAGLGPFAPEVYRVPFPNAYRGISADDALEALERAFTTQVARETVAAIILEPVQGEGGFIVAAAGVRPGRARDLRPRGDRDDRRRGADGLRPHRQDVRDRALRRRARPHARWRSRSPPACRSPASSARPRSWTRPGNPRSVAPMSATRSRRRRRSPSSTCSRTRGSSTAPSASARRFGAG